jgi:hypothetical protein
MSRLPQLGFGISCITPHGESWWTGSPIRANVKSSSQPIDCKDVILAAQLLVLRLAQARLQSLSSILPMRRLPANHCRES